MQRTWNFISYSSLQKSLTSLSSSVSNSCTDRSSSRPLKKVKCLVTFQYLFWSFSSIAYFDHCFGGVRTSGRDMNFPSM